jgi:hypothetical protein
MEVSIKIYPEETSLETVDLISTGSFFYTVDSAWERFSTPPGYIEHKKMQN